MGSRCGPLALGMHGKRLQESGKKKFFEVDLPPLLDVQSWYISW